MAIASNVWFDLSQRDQGQHEQTALERRMLDLPAPDSVLQLIRRNKIMRIPLEKPRDWPSVHAALKEAGVFLSMIYYEDGLGEDASSAATTSAST